MFLAIVLSDYYDTTNPNPNLDETSFSHFAAFSKEYSMYLLRKPFNKQLMNSA